jgi:hypothetical protein
MGAWVVEGAVESERRGIMLLAAENPFWGGKGRSLVPTR